MNFWLCLQRASVFGLAALAIALLLQWILANRVPASWRVWLWRVALLQSALALLPLAPIALAVLPAQPAIVLAPSTSDSAPSTSDLAPSTSDSEPSTSDSAASTSDSEPSTFDSEPSTSDLAPSTSDSAAPTSDLAASTSDSAMPRAFGWRALLVSIYFVGIGVQLLILARNARRVRRVLRDCTPLDNAPLRAIAARLRLRQTPRLLHSAGGAPFLCGIWRPTIVLPSTLDEAHLEAVLAHELAHFKRRDLAWNALLWAPQTLLWFHPLSWIARRFHALEVESACDELTLQLTQIAPRTYGALLLQSMNKHHSPLTAGVNDGFFALKTRLSRLGQSPKSPRKRTRIALVAALLVSFGAVVPVELTARAQKARKIVQLSGIVKDQSGNPVADATVYATERDNEIPIGTAVTDQSGRFRFSELAGDKSDVFVFADAGARGMGESFVGRVGSQLRVADVTLLPAAPVKLLLLDPDGQRAANVRVRLGQIGKDAGETWTLPRPVAESLQTFTNARGEAVFAALPQGQVAQFWLGDTTLYRTTEYGIGDLRGGQYAPIGSGDAVTIGASKGWKVIRLLPSVSLQGRVTTPAGVGKSGALVLARRIEPEESAAYEFDSDRFVPQTRADASGNYSMEGLRPGLYRVEVADEAWLNRTYTSSVETRELTSPHNRVDLALSRGGLVHGIVTYRGWDVPLVGQTVQLLDSEKKYQFTKTDAKGAFQFRANAGVTMLWLQRGDFKVPLSFLTGEFSFASATMETYADTTERGFRHISTTTFDKLTIASPDHRNSRNDVEINASEIVFLPLKADAKRDIEIQSAIKPASLGKTASLSGTIVLPNGKGATAVITIWPAASPKFEHSVQTVADAKGRYSIEGLKPGRYNLTVSLDAKLAKHWGAPKLSQQNLKAGANRVDFKLSHGALIKSTAKATAGTVVGPDGQPIAGATVVYRMAASPHDNQFHTLQSDAGGRFILPPRWSAVPAQLWADAGALTTPRPLIAASGAMVKLQLQNGAWAKVSGRVTDENNRAVAGARVTLRQDLGDYMVNPTFSAVSDADGRYRIARLRPGLAAHINATKPGYAPNVVKSIGIIKTLQVGENRAFDVPLRSANKPLAGRVWDEDGKPARNYKVWAIGPTQPALTNTTGHFAFAQVLDGEMGLSITSPDNNQTWVGFEAVGGDKNVAIRLNKKSRVTPQIFLQPANAVTGTVTGTARDESGQPLAGVKVWAYTQSRGRGEGSSTATTGADGAYRFADFPAPTQVAVIASRQGYGVLPTPNDDAFGLDYQPLAVGQTRTIDVTMRVAPATLAGKVLKADGTLAVNYHVVPRKMRLSATTKINGRFWMAGVWSGSRDVYVYNPMSRQRWGPYRAEDNQRDLVLRLSEKTRDKNYVLGNKNP